MDPMTPPQNPNPNPNPSKNVYQIGGVPVEFPYKPYGSQLAFMGRVISSLDRARRQGHCHALLESPTGTGKSLSLLCSSLAWQQQQRLRSLDQPPAAPSPPIPAPAPVPSTPAPSLHPLVHGGGFLPENQPSAQTAPNPEDQTTKGLSRRAQRKLTAPTIYYASRTHSQISQVVREYRKTSYRVPMAVLASRKHYCTNKNVSRNGNIDEECKLLLKDPGAGCLQFRNANKVSGHPSLQSGGCHEVHDIEDLVRIGHTVKGCSYFAAQTLAEEAQLVFCPYSYVINPIVRRAMDIDIKGSIVILDEAHNIEDMAREAGSLDVEEETLYTLQTELGQLCTVETVATIYQPLYDMIQGIVSWIRDRVNNLQQREFEHYSSYWTGDKATRELQHAGVNQQCFPILQECATKAIKAASDKESDGVHLSGISAITLEGLVSSFGYFFSGNGCHALDYQLALQRYVKRDCSNAAPGWTCLLSLWCLNPSIVFKEIADLSLSVILTSGTLSPMGSFSSELGVQFEACMEAPHVIDVDSQLWAAVISSGPGNCKLNASYKTSDGFGFQDALGASLEEICKITPGGALVFFPSYKLLEKVQVRWYQTGQWSRLNAQKPIFVEPRGSTEDFEPILKSYYDSIQGKVKVARAKPKRSVKRASKYLSTVESSEIPVKGGAAFLAVCRGKVSEGIDFSDENARVVVIVGIPFPNTNDIQIVLKKKYNDTFKSSKGLLSGSQWYCHQAFRALNQAAGRCIRHRFDYGAIILLDERYEEERNLGYISKWLKKSIKHYGSFDESLDSLQSFFADAEKRLNQNRKDVLQPEFIISDSRTGKLPLSKENLNLKVPRKRNQKPNMLYFQNKGDPVPENNLAQLQAQLVISPSPLKKVSHILCGIETESKATAKARGETTEKLLNSYEEHNELESSFHTPSRCSEASFVKSSIDISNQPLIVKSTTTEDQITHPADSLKDESLSLLAAPTCSQSIESPSFTFSGAISNDNLSGAAFASKFSPGSVLYSQFINSELKPSLDAGVSSNRQRKRKVMYNQLGSCAETDCCSTFDSESFGNVANPRTSGDTVQITDSNLTKTDSRQQLPPQGMLLKNSCSSLHFPPNLSPEKKMYIYCSFCKSSLGLHEHNFLVTCSLTLLSKVYISHVLKYGPARTCLSGSDQLTKTQNANTKILISDVSLVDQRILNRRTRDNNFLNDTWSEEDGCVFRMVYCPFCISYSTFLGVRVIATDSANLFLLNKVLFYAEHLDITNEQKQTKEVLLGADQLDITKEHTSDIKNKQTHKSEVVQRASADSITKKPAFVDIEKYAYTPLPKASSLSVKMNSKLSLPKRGQCSTQHLGE